MVSLLIITALTLTAPGKTSTSQVGELLSTCHRIASARNYKLHGRLHVLCSVGEGGKVTRVFIKKGSIQSAVLTRCVKYHLLKQRFPGRKKVEFRLTFPRSRGQYAVWSQDIPINRSLGNRAAARVVLDAKSAATKRFSLSVLRIAKGGRLTPRFHPDAHLFVFVLDGSGQLEWAKSMNKTKYLPVSRGSAVYLPKGTVYQARGNSDPPLVLALFSTPRGPEAYLAGGLTGRDTILIPPNGLSQSAKKRPVPGAGSKSVHAHVNFSQHGKFRSGPVIAVAGVGTLGIQMAPAGSSLSVAPRGRSEVGIFVVQGGGVLKNSRGSWPVQPGSGLYFPMRGTYLPRLKKIPFYGVWFSTAKAPKIGTKKVLP